MFSAVSKLQSHTGVWPVAKGFKIIIILPSVHNHIESLQDVFLRHWGMVKSSAGSNLQLHYITCCDGFSQRIRFKHTEHITMHVVQKEHFFREFPVILKHSLQNYWKISEEIVTDSSVWIMIRWMYVSLSAGSNLQLHYNVSSVVKMRLCAGNSRLINSTSRLVLRFVLFIVDLLFTFQFP